MPRSGAASPLNRNISSATVDTLLLTLLKKLDKEKEETVKVVPFQAEVRTLEFWRSVVAECVGTFFLTFLTCGAFVPWSGHSPPPIGIGLTIGFGITMLTHCFALISGAHFNPIITLSLVVKRSMSPFRGALYFSAQIGGAIAGSALLYGVTASGSQGSLGVTMLATGLRDWQGFAIELCFSFIIVLTYLCSLHPEQRRTVSTSMGCGPIVIGFSYLACSLVALPSTGASFNPVRSLGPAFVMNKWDSHWIYWVGPLLGGAFGGLIHEFVFNAYRDGSPRKSSGDGDSSSVHSDEECYEEGPTGPPLRGPVPGALARSQHYETYKPIALGNGGPENLCKSSRNIDQTESIYAGTRSLYCRSPIATQRSMLNRSQSVYTKSPNMITQPQRIHPAASVITTKASGFEALTRQENPYSGRTVAEPARSESIYVPRGHFQKEVVYYSKTQTENMYATKPPLPSDPYPSRPDTGYSCRQDQGYQAPLPPTPVNEDQKLEEENMRNSECTKTDFDPYTRNEEAYVSGRKFQPRHESVCGIVPPLRREDSKHFSPNNSHSDSAYGSVNTPCTPNANKTFNYSHTDQQNKNYQQSFENFRNADYSGNSGSLVVDATRDSLYGYTKPDYGQTSRQNGGEKSQVQSVRY